MKFRILVSVLMLIFVNSISSVALARDVKRGTMQISGDSDFGFGKITEKVEGNKESKITSIDLSVEALYYVVDNFSVGFLVGYNNSDFKYDTITQNSTSKRVGPVFQISVPMNSNTNLFIGATAGYVSEKADDYYDASGFFYGATAGISLFPVNNFSVDIGASYLHDNGNDDISKLDVKRDSVRGKVGLSVYF